MATKARVEGILSIFSQIWTQVTVTNDLVEAYCSALHGCSDKQVKEAGNICMEECEYFPKPFEILKRTNKALHMHNKKLVDRYTCSTCHEKVSAMSEGICLDCGGFLPADKKHIELPESESNFKIEGRRKCNRCVNISDCIKEPADSEEWLCKMCYSGLTRKQDAERFRDLIEMMDTKQKTSWMKELVPF